MSLLEVRNLVVSLNNNQRSAAIVDGLSLTLEEGNCLGIVGESGSGKSTVALALLGLLTGGPLAATGSVKFAGNDILAMSTRQLREIQGKDIAMIFQDPLSSLNPVHRVGAQIIESVTTHERVSRKEATARAVEALTRVGMPDPVGMMRRYPHQLSGGQRQRVMIAMAIVFRPKLLIADEPTTALDLTIQTQILQLLKSLARDLNMALLLITHDLGVVAEMSDRVIVLYSGREVESGPTADVLENPQHPYTKGLLKAHPSLDIRSDRLVPIPGAPPSPWQRPAGCAFQPRCPLAQDGCTLASPEQKEIFGGVRRVACFLAEDPNVVKAIS